MTPSVDEARVAEVARSLSGYDAYMIAGAWQGASGRWYINGRCRHLHARDLCRLTGVLTTHGEAVRQYLIQQEAEDVRR